MRLRKLWLLVGVVFAGLVLVTTGSARQTSSKKASTLVIGLEQEPGILNGDITGGDALATAYVLEPLFEGSYKLYPNFAFRPDVAAKVTVQQHPFRLTYHINKKAVWNDGGKKVPITAADYVFGWHTIMNPKNQILGTTGYDQIKSATIINKKTVRFTFSTPYAGYKLLFAGQGILPSFALKNQDFNKVWLNFVNDPRNNKPLSDGAFIMPNANAWSHGRQLVETRNPLYWQAKPKLSKLIFNFSGDSQTEAQQIKAGEIDVFDPQPQAFLVPLKHTAGIHTQVALGPIFEYIGFNLGYKRSEPLLSQLWFRQAFAYAIDRQAMVRALYTATGIAPGLPVYQNEWLFNSSPYYKPLWAYVKHNGQKAINLLRSHGCTGGPAKPGKGGIYTCKGVKASFRFQWRSPNQIRTEEFETLKSQVAQVGIELTADSSTDLYTSRFPRGDTDIYVAGWQGSPDLSGLDQLYGCRDDATNYAQQNYQGYCDKTVTRLLKQVNQTFNSKVQAAIFNRAMGIMAKALPVIPLYQKPAWLVYRTKWKNLRENPTSETFLYNINRVTS
jgi:peptide/nickel transport system substrate-binding protein